MNRTHDHEWVYAFWLLIAFAALLAVCSCGQQVVTDTKPPDSGRVNEREEPEWLNEINKKCKEWKTYWFWYEGKLENVSLCVRF